MNVDQMGEFGRLIWQHWTGIPGGAIGSVVCDQKVLFILLIDQKKFNIPADYSKRKYSISGFVTLRNTTKRQNWSALPCVTVICPRFYRLLQYKSKGVNFDQNSPICPAKNTGSYHNPAFCIEVECQFIFFVALK